MMLHVVKMPLSQALPKVILLFLVTLGAYHKDGIPGLSLLIDPILHYFRFHPPFTPIAPVLLKIPMIPNPQ